MHHPDLTASVIRSLGWLYLLLSIANFFWAARSLKRDGYYERVAGFNHIPKATIWAAYGSLLLLVALAHLVFHSSPNDFMIRLPEWFKSGLAGPSSANPNSNKP